MNAQEKMDGSNLNFTVRARQELDNVINDPYFRDADSDMIFDLLNERMKIVFFGDFLKRYIYAKAEMQGDYQEIPLSEYVDIICCEFADRQTPCSFTETTVCLKNAAKNWLEQKTVSRQVVLILGFGLGMSVDDVNTFLTKALQEPELNAKDPEEAVCWYCYRHGLTYLKYKSLCDGKRSDHDESTGTDPLLDKTVDLKRKLSDIHDDTALLDYLSVLPIAKGTKRQSITAREYFDQLYHKTREIAARVLSESERDAAEKRASRLGEKLSRDDRLYDYQKRQKVAQEKEDYKTYSADEIGAADIENMILSAVPKDANGNLVTMKLSALYSQFSGKRLSRQHIAEIISGKAPIMRYDLITLNFFIYAQTEFETVQERYAAFIDSTNTILKSCGMGPIYVVNPYECFLLMCMVSDDPLCTYADVWELSYENE